MCVCVHVSARTAPPYICDHYAAYLYRLPASSPYYTTRSPLYCQVIPSLYCPTSTSHLQIVLPPLPSPPGTLLTPHFELLGRLYPGAWLSRRRPTHLISSAVPHPSHLLCIASAAPHPSYLLCSASPILSPLQRLTHLINLFTYSGVSLLT